MEQISKRTLVLLCLVSVATAFEVTNINDVNTDVGAARDGTITLSGGSNNIWYNLVYVIPILLAIILLDFAIFGTFATRADSLNPVSRFFYQARIGLANIRNRNRRYYQQRQHLRPYYGQGYNNQQFRARLSEAEPEHKVVERWKTDTETQFHSLKQKLILLFMFFLQNQKSNWLLELANV